MNPNLASWFKVGLRTLSILFVALILFFIFGGPVFGPLFEYEGQEIDLHRYLSSCRSNELRLSIDSNPDGHGGYGRLTLNFPSGKSEVGSGCYNYQRWFLCWNSMGSGFCSVPIPSAPPPYNPEQMVRIKSELANLAPDDNKWLYDSDSYRNEFHLAFYLGSQLCLYHYSPDKIPPHLEELCRAMGISFSFDYWKNKGHTQTPPFPNR